MKNEDYKIESADESIEQTFRNGIEYFNVAIMLMKQYNLYNFFSNEDLDPIKLKDKYTKMNVIFMNFSFAYENLMKYLLLKNQLNVNPKFQKDDLWGKWIYKHGVKQLYDVASTQENYKIYNFCNSLLRIINISRNLSEFKLLSNKSLKYQYVDSEIFSKQHIEWELETWTGMNEQFNDEKLAEFLINNDELFIKSRYSGQNKTNYNFTEIYYFIQGIYDYVNIIHNNGGVVPKNIEREYLKYKLNNSEVKKVILNRYTEQEIDELMKIIKDNNILIRVLLGPDCYGLKHYSVDDIKGLIQSDIIFQDEHYLFLAIILGLNEREINEQKKQGKNIKQFIDFYNSQLITQNEEKQETSHK